MSALNKIFSGKLKGAMTYFSDLAVALTSLLSSVFMLFIGAVVVFIIHLNVIGTVYGTILYESPRANSDLLVFSDLITDGEKNSDLLFYSVYFGNESFALNGKQIDLKNLAKAQFDKIEERDYKATLRIEDREVVLARRGPLDVKDKNVRCSSLLLKSETKSGSLILCRRVTQ